MRLMLAALLLYLSPLAAAATPSASSPSLGQMPGYDGFMDKCLWIVLGELGEDAKREGASMRSALECQCRHDALPAAGKEVTVAIYAGAIQACKDERAANPQGFEKSYRDRWEEAGAE